MQPASKIPRAALVLGWLGVLPFAAFSLATVTGAVLPRSTSVSGLVLYAAIILSFMGGAQWGIAMLKLPDYLASRLAISVLPALAAFGLWFMPPTIGLAGLSAAFLALLAYDVATARVGLVPAWYPALRMQLTGAVVACLLLAMPFGSR